MHQRANEVEPALAVRGENNVSESDGKELRTWCLATSGPGLQRVWALHLGVRLLGGVDVVGGQNKRKMTADAAL